MSNPILRPLILALTLCGALATSSSFAVSSTTEPLLGHGTASLAPMLKRVTPAIVNITAQGKIPAALLPSILKNRDQHGADPFDPNSKAESGEFVSAGSGVIINAADGYIVTNAHVVSEADSISVTLSDGRHFKAKLIGADPGSDVAVVQIQAPSLQAIPLGNSDNLQVGDVVVAIGNPFGLNQTVTSGIVSALGRTNLGLEGYENFIQTDAAINHGNSGGALVNIAGQLVGINTAIVTPDGGNVGISFAIPINMAYSVMQQLIKYGKVNRGLLGILVQNLTPELASAFNFKETEGALVTEITPDSPAAAAGLHPGDLITSINGRPVTNSATVKNTIGLLRIGDKVDLEVLHAGKKEQYHIEIGNPKAMVATLHKRDPFFHGVDLRELQQVQADHGMVTGIQVLAIEPDSPAWISHLRPGDVIISANQQPVHTLQQLKDIAEATQNNQLLLHILRDDGAIFLVLRSNV